MSAFLYFSISAFQHFSFLLMTTVIQVENLSKRYRLGVIGRTALHEDVSRWWARVRGRPDPTLRLDQVDLLRQTREAAGARARDLKDDAEHVWALRDVNFAVQQGEILGIIGRNGAGKSTLLKILTRVTAPTLGTVKMKGRVASLLEVGTGFHPELTGRENIFLNGTILGMTRAEVRRKFDEIVAFSGCETYIDTPVKRYSSGMYVRMAFAVAAHLDPDILIVDEVLAVGDAEFQKKCLGKMQDVAGQGRTVIFVSHNMGLVRELCQRGLVLRSGAVVYDGSSAGAIEHYMMGDDAEQPGCDLQEWSRPEHITGRARLETATIVSAHGKGVLNYEDPLCLRLQIRAVEPCHAFGLGVAIRTMGTIPVGTVFTEDVLSLQAGEVASYTVTFPSLALAPAHYSLTLAVGVGGATGPRTDYDMVEGVCRFEVMPIIGSSGKSVRWHPSWGAIRLPAPTVEGVPTDGEG
jgi:lipopolysaccharide transport system ATP-binding protein